MYILHYLGILPPTRTRARGAAPASPSDSMFEKTIGLSKSEHLRAFAHVAPHRRALPAPGYGYPVHVVRATVPSQMPLRRVVSQSETISALSQYETLGTLSKALRLAYSASGPPHGHTARRSTTGHTMRSSRTALHPRCRHEPRGCDLNSVHMIEITQHRADFQGEGNRLLPTSGRGEGVRPRTPARGGTPGRGFPA